jgi:hypothetical protein
VHTADASVTVDGRVLMADAVHADGFQWIDCDTNLPIPGATGAVFEAPNSGSYALIVENGGCRATTECIPFVITGLEDQEHMVRNIWPNPTSGLINVSLTEDLGLADISIWDHLGKVLVQNQIDLLSPVLSVHIPGGRGVYYVRVQSKSRTNTYKVIKK